MGSNNGNGKKTILVVDDEQALRYSVRRILDKKYMIIEAICGEQAIELAKEHKPDLILMDMMMPEVDGLTACSALREIPEIKATPIIMLSGIGFELNKALALSVGINQYLTKPFKPKELHDAIEGCLSKC